MNSIDITLLVCLAAAAVAGYRKGIIPQACGIAGLVLGILLGLRLGRAAGNALGVDDTLASVIGFIVVLLASIIALALVGWLFSRVFRLTGFGYLDRVGGALLGIVKAGLLLSVLVGFFVRVNRQYDWLPQDVFSESKVLHALDGMTDAVFPFLQKAGESLFSQDAKTLRA